MFSGLLPIGTVVMLKDSSKRVMIIGLLQQQIVEGDDQIIWDYSGCFYPEGYMGPDKTFLFNADQIDKVYAVGYQDEEQFAFKVKIDEIKQQIEAQNESEETDESSEETKEE